MKKVNKKTIIIISAILCMSMVSGYFLGKMIYDQRYSGINYDAYTEAALREDSAKIAEIIKKADTHSPLELTATENFIIAEERLKSATAVSIETVGTVKAAGTNQNIKSYKIKNNNTYYKESLSAGFVSVAERFFYNSSDNSFVLQKSKSIDKNNLVVTSWSDSDTPMTYENFCSTNGVRPDVFLVYIVSSKTVLDGSSVTQETVDGQTLYKLSLSLDRAKSVINYVKQMKYISGLNDYPVFDYINLSVYINSNWEFVFIDIAEKYTAKMGITAKCEGVMRDTFNYSNPLPIPSKG